MSNPFKPLTLQERGEKEGWMEEEELATRDGRPSARRSIIRIHGGVGIERIE